MDKLAETAFSDVEWLNCVKDLLKIPEVQEMKQFKHHTNTTCFEHCVHVSYLSYLCMKRMNRDGYSAARVGLLHDLFLYQRADLPSRVKRVTHLFTHGKVAMLNAEQIVDLTKKERRAIARHMFPLTIIPSVSREGILLCYYDKVCFFKEMRKKT